MTAALIAVGAWFGWPVLAGIVLLVVTGVQDWRLDRDAGRRLREFELLNRCWNLPDREPHA